MRDRSEWTDLVEKKFAIIAGLDSAKILNTIDSIINSSYIYPKENQNIFGEGDAGKIIVDTLSSL